MNRRHPVLALVLVLAALLTACSTSSDLTATGEVTAGASTEAPPPDGAGPVGEPIEEFTPQALRAIAEQSLEGSSGRAEMVMAMDASGIPGMPGGMSMSLDMSAEWDDAGNQRVVLDMSAMLDAIAGAAGEEIPDEMAPMFEAFASPIEVRLVDGQVYMTSTFFNGLLSLLGQSVPTEWMSVDPAVYGQDGASDVMGSNPEMARDFLQFLRGAGEVVDLGDADVRGVTTNHLQAVVTLQGLLDSAASQAEADELRDLWDELGATGDFGGPMGDVPLTFEVWIDDTGVLHRMAMVIDAADIGAATGGTGMPPGAEMQVSFTVDFFDFGADIVITAPPAEQVTDATDLFESLAGMGF